MAGRFEGKVAVVTGAGSGIGRAVALRFAAEGGQVFAVDIDEVRLKGLRGESPSLVTHAADISQPDVCTTLVEVAVGAFGGIDILANVAGILHAGHFTDHRVEDYRRVMAVNIDAPFLLTQAAIPHLLGRAGNVVNVVSNSALQGIPYAAAYATSKGALLQLTRALAVEYLKTPLRINAVAPAGTRTNIAANATFPADGDVSLMARMAGLRGIAEPEDVAATVAFLASDEARSVTGAVYTVDNGLTAS